MSAAGRPNTAARLGDQGQNTTTITISTPTQAAWTSTPTSTHTDLGWSQNVVAHRRSVTSPLVTSDSMHSQTTAAAGYERRGPQITGARACAFGRRGMRPRDAAASGDGAPVSCFQLTHVLMIVAMAIAWQSQQTPQMNVSARVMTVAVPVAWDPALHTRPHTANAPSHAAV